MENISSVGCLLFNNDIKFTTLVFCKLSNYGAVLLSKVDFELLWSETIDFKSVNTNGILISISENPYFAIKCVIFNSGLGLFMSFSKAFLSETNTISNEAGRIGRVHIFKLIQN